MFAVASALGTAVGEKIGRLYRQYIFIITYLKPAEQYELSGPDPLCRKNRENSGLTEAELIIAGRIIAGKTNMAGS